MNTRAATLFEGIANNAILIAHGVTEIDELPDEDLQIGVLLALLQDDAKNQSSYLTWGKGQREGGADSAARFSGHRRARRQTFRRVGKTSVAGPDVSAGYRAGTEAWRSCGGVTKPRTFCRRCTGATDWLISRAWKARWEKLSAEEMRGYR